MSKNVKDRFKYLDELYKKPPGIEREVFSVETLLDILVVLYDECNTTQLRRNKHVVDFLEIAKPVANRIKNLRLARDDFDTLNIIGRGAFGEVAVVRMKSTNKIFAMKTLNKWEMLKRAETACFREERDVLVFGDSRWITKLHYAFQDTSNLYFVMDYYSGGDLLTLLAKYEDHIPEEMLKFYAAEIILAIDSIHRMKYVHRDIKPDNVLLDYTGHVRLADFGSCLKIADNGYVVCSVAVGTPDYISPEILQAMEDGKGQYGVECDWWSLGICCYEMIYGETPFYAESLIETYGKIMEHKNKFSFPDDIEVSNDCKDLMSRLICDVSERLGKNGIKDFKLHPFFKGIDWDNIYKCKPPYVPELDGETDVSNFDVDDLNEAKTKEFAPPPSNQVFTGLHLPFIGFTYTKESVLSDSGDGANIVSENSIRQDPEGAAATASTILERKIKNLNEENMELNKKLDLLKRSESIKSSGVSAHDLSKKNSELEVRIEILEKENKELKLNTNKVLKDDGKIHELERTKNLLVQEKENLINELNNVKAKIIVLQKDYQEAVLQRKQTMEEFSDLNEKLADVRSQKIKLARLVREKEEEIENSMNKLEQIRKECRAAEKSKHELIAQVEEMKVDLQKEEKLRIKADLYCQQLEEEIESLHHKVVPNSSRSDSSQEINRLKSELEKVKKENEEVLTKERKQLSIELKVLEEKYNDMVKNNAAHEEEIKLLKEKLQKKRKESESVQQEALIDYKNASLRNSNVLKNENDRLSAQVKELTSQLEQISMNHKNLEAELRLSSEKHMDIAQWEEQVAEIVQWVSDEKDARGYLQALASRMTDELESLKNSTGGGNKNWQARRSQKLDKQELLSLQASLSLEVQAKQQLNDELIKIKNLYSQTERRNEELENQLKTFQKELDHLHQESNTNKLGGSGFSFSFLNLLAPEVLTLPEDLPKIKEEEDQKSIETVEVDTAIQSVASIKSIEKKEEKSDHDHQFLTKTFNSPTKCHVCMSIMFGFSRQGNLCGACGYNCHMHCIKEAVKSCPAPQHLLTNQPLGIDPNTGAGTAYEGLVKIPKPGGIKRGWIRAFAVVCDFKVLFYETVNDKTPTNTILEVIDMRDEDFSVSSVLVSDVIHAKKSDINNIFKICVGKSTNGFNYEQLVLCDKEIDHQKWIGTLQELAGLYNKCHGSERKNKYVTRDIVENIPILRTTVCAAVIDITRIVCGSEEGLYSYHLGKESLTRIDETKKVVQIEMVHADQLLIVLSGKQRYISLYSLSVVEGLEIEPIKIPDSKGALFFTVGSIRQSSCTCLCVAQKKSAILYELNRTKTRYRKMRDVPFNFSCQWVGIYNNKLLVGYPSGFVMIDILKESPPIKLINNEDSSLKFMSSMHTDALLAAEVSADEYLLCFKELAFYVNINGIRSRPNEIAYPTPVNYLAFSKPFLLTYTDRGVDVFEVTTSSWIQTLQILKVVPLSMNGMLSLSATPEHHVMVYLKRENIDEELAIKTSLVKRQVAAIYRIKSTTKKRLSVKTRDSLRAEEADLVSKLISGPSNFSHVQHMGPGDSLQILKEIPVGDEKLRVPTIFRPSRPLSSYQSSPPSEDQLRANMNRSRSMDGNDFLNVDPDSISSNSSTSNTSGLEEVK
ncbi:serine/threonine-protein kinase MRCK alpha isoform X2 [Hydra vulgaris]|uniref:non-specific serine/threonine protein kinase n=1 Tax=Hydra vulgaris TaxID=6087 RepID=A0ABM4C0Q2_HYDVU